MGCKVRWLAAVSAIVGEGACAQIAGLPDYSTGESLAGSDSYAPVVRTDASADETGDELGNEGPRENDAGGVGNADDAGAGDTGQPIDAGQPERPQWDARRLHLSARHVWRLLQHDGRLRRWPVRRHVWRGRTELQGLHELRRLRTGRVRESAA